MLTPIRYIVWFLTYVVLSLRYRVEVRGLDAVRGMKKTLVLPNHPGYMDPLVVLRAIWPALKPRPMMFDGLVKNPVLFWIPIVLDAVLVGNTDQQSAQVREQAEQAIERVATSLRAGDNQLLWPAGRVWHQDHEVLGAARAVAEILRRVPDAQVILIRTRGLWGSSFGYAYTGAQPLIVKRLVVGALHILSNLIFFTPRRRLTVTIEKIDRSRLPDLTQRDKVNAFLEQWYNAEGSEGATYVPYHFALGARTYEFPAMNQRREIDFANIKATTRDAVNEIVQDKLKRPLSDAERNPATTFENLGMDSLERMELSLQVEQRFGFSSDQVPVTLGDLWALAQGLVEKAQPAPPPPAWFAPLTSDKKAALLADDIPHALVKRALASKKDTFAADDLSGAITYERFLTGALLMSRRFAEIPAPNVGLMLPASVAVDVCFAAMHLAGKLPVMLNWTTGPANLAHAAKLMGLTHVVTSKKFVDRTHIVVEGTQYVFLEDIRAKIGKLESLAALLRVRFAGGSILRHAPSPDVNKPAAVLFTSGSEKAPKAVPLTHRNLLSNLASVLSTIPVDRNDAILGFLPPFHSFGLTITTLLPMLTGLRVVHHPDPTDAAALASKAVGYKPTVLCATPTFCGFIFERVKPGELRSLRMVVVGAEKCPPAIFEKAASVAPSAKVIEGYGITECSPLVAVNRLENPEPGTVGKAVPGVEIIAVDPEKHTPVPTGQLGMLLVTGPNVFPGYIGHDGPQPFVEQDGKRWYVTGDLATIDTRGVITFSGRLKRFLKAGGEMISLPALEEPFTRKYPATDKGPRVAVEGIETDHGRLIVLFTTETISVKEANELLMSAGMRGVMRLDAVERIEAIPVLGTGKTDYKVLRARIEKHGVKQ